LHSEQRPRMPTHPSLDQPGLTATLTKGFVKMLGAVPRRRASRPGRVWRSPDFRRFFRRDEATVASPLAPEPADPIAMVVMAVDRLGPAAIRACCSGVSVRVTVPDDQTATIFRAALAVTQTRRTTDRLIEIIVEDGRGKAKAASEYRA
jgi:hypothetical protein